MVSRPSKTAYLLVLAAVAIAGSMVFFVQDRSLPYATCPSAAFVTDHQACSGWAGHEISDVRITLAADGSCQVCVNPLGSQAVPAAYGPGKSPALCDYQQIARSETARRFPDYRTDRPLVFRDEGDTREMAFQLPPGYAGGSPHVDIRKSSCAVSRVYGSQ
jgi:hypothetical protein